MTPVRVVCLIAGILILSGEFLLSLFSIIFG